MMIDTPLLPGIKRISLKCFEDERGFFMESYNARALKDKEGIDAVFVQDNQSRSRKNIVRGLHYQITHPQGKLVRALSGVIYDVAVDLRKHSPSFGKWMGVVLDSQKHEALWIPEGFAHGFMTLSEQADVFYKTTDFYDPTGERCLLWNDPVVGIIWPNQGQPVLSEKDLKGQSLNTLDLFP